ncbi:hypothetical protein CDAR_10661 [Caerostris darwini]|uniref:Uncharacterized protein n=1 Tax=Caerostris darwini TaxID=1538125 RepID=A0AAV4SZ54_9ARAC|nr:hypothetical protein CDAR_10661 [Caerostris darwini]
MIPVNVYVSQTNHARRIVITTNSPVIWYSILVITTLDEDPKSVHLEESFFSLLFELRLFEMAVNDRFDKNNIRHCLHVNAFQKFHPRAIFLVAGDRAQRAISKMSLLNKLGQAKSLTLMF